MYGYRFSYILCTLKSNFQFSFTLGNVETTKLFWHVILSRIIVELSYTNLDGFSFLKDEDYA